MPNIVTVAVFKRIYKHDNTVGYTVGVMTIHILNSFIIRGDLMMFMNGRARHTTNLGTITTMSVYSFIGLSGSLGNKNITHGTSYDH